MNNKIIKELIIILLLFIVIIFVMGILFYNFIPSNAEEFSSVDYVTSDDVNTILDEIEANSGVNIKNEDSNSLLKSYTITKEDLNEYASENSYESGKKDPFSESSETVESVVTTQTTEVQATQNQVSNPYNSLVENQGTEEKEETEKTEEAKEIKAETKTETKVEAKEETKESSSTTGTFFEKANSK
jgi:hypothetical protein